VRVRAGRAQRMGERALRIGKTAGGASWVRVRLETVHKGGVRAGMVRKTVLWIL
jgi:hypothetical protein